MVARELPKLETRVRSPARAYFLGSNLRFRAISFFIYKSKTIFRKMQIAKGLAHSYIVAFSRNVWQLKRKIIQLVFFVN